MDEDLIEVWQYVCGNLTPEQLCRFAQRVDKFCETMYSDYKVTA